MSEETRLSIKSRAFMKQAWALTKPFWFSEEKWIARGLLAAVVTMNLAIVGLSVVHNYWYNHFYNSLQDLDAESFGQLLIMFAFLAAVRIALYSYQLYINLYLQIRWRSWLTKVYFGEWLGNRVYYRMELKSYGTDNPDQRIQEDVKLFTSSTLGLALGLMRSIVSLLSFVLILWTLSGPLNIPGTSLSIPGYMVWVAIVYSIAGTWLTHLIGRPLIPLNFDQQRYEADFRFALMRLRENAEGVALYRGETSEQQTLSQRFGLVWTNWLGLMKYQKRITGFTSFYDQIASIFPIVVAAPRFFSKAIQLGGLMQIASAFGRVQDALSWFIGAYTSLAEWKATVDRLTSFHLAITKAGEEAKAAGGIKVESNGSKDLSTRDLHVALPDGRILLKDIDTTFIKGEHTLVTGPSGSGKSTLFRVLSGIWPFGTGTVEMPSDAKVMFLPQKPYLPLGSLREVVCYPALSTDFGDAQIVEALRLCRLEHLQSRLDDVDNWAMRLSPGEQQRLAVTRALLNQPDWLFLDEATAALDQDTESYLYHLLRERLPHITLVSIAHRAHVAAHHQRQLELIPDAEGGRFENRAIVPA